MTLEAYCFHKSFEPAGPSEFRMDRHYLLYALKGTLRLEAGGRRWLLPPARAALIKADHPVAISILTPLTSASVLFAPDFIPEPEQALVVFDISPLARELITECLNWGPETSVLPPYARQVFQTLAAVVEKLVKNPSPCVLPIPQSKLLMRALELTEAQAGGNPNFEDIASASGQSPRSLARRFSGEMGMTWREALRRIRIMRAVELLAGSDSPVTEIAFQTGYSSLSAFNNAFRDLTGTNPTEYRASFKRGASKN